MDEMYPCCCDCGSIASFLRVGDGVLIYECPNDGEIEDDVICWVDSYMLPSDDEEDEDDEDFENWDDEEIDDDDYGVGDKVYFGFDDDDDDEYDEP